MLGVNRLTTDNNLTNCYQLRKGDVYPVTAHGDRDLIVALISYIEERGISQNEVARRTGVSQSSISRLIRIVEAGGDPGELRSATRDALVHFLAASGSAMEERAIAVGRQIAANILEEVARLLRRGANQAPLRDVLPPDVRRLFDELDERTTGSRAGESKPAHWDTLERAAEAVSEERKRRRQRPRASGDE